MLKTWNEIFIESCCSWESGPGADMSVCNYLSTASCYQLPSSEISTDQTEQKLSCLVGLADQIPPAGL